MEKLVSYRELAEHYGIGMSAMYKRVHYGDAPTPQLNAKGRVIGWRRSAIKKYDDARNMTRVQYLYQ